MVLTDPKVSTTDNDLHKILFFFIAPAVIIRQVVKAIGKPSGMNATATETKSTIKVDVEIQFGYDFFNQAPQIIQIITINVTIIETVSKTNLKISFCKGDNPDLGSEDSFAI